MAERVLAREDVRSIATPTMSISVGGGPTGMDDLHELRVRIPMNLHRQLLSLKVLRGRSLAETVSMALDMYFAQVKAPPSTEDKESRSSEN